MLREAEQEGHPGDRLRVAPVHVVEDEERGTACRQHGPAQAFEEPVPLPRVRDRPRTGRRARGGRVRCPRGATPARYEPLDLGLPHRVEARDRAPQVAAAQPVRHRRQRQPSRRPEAARRGHERAATSEYGAQLGDQPALPDTWLPRDRDEPRGPAAGLLPPPHEERQLAAPADEACSGGADPHRTPSSSGWLRTSTEQPLDQRCGRCRRPDAELLLEDGGAVVVGTDRRGDVPRLEEQLHQRAMADLLQRFEPDPATGHPHRCAPVPGLPLDGDGQVAQLHALPSQPLALVDHPVTGHPGEELAPVLEQRRLAVSPHGSCVPVRAGGQRGVPLPGEHADIDPARGGVPPQERRLLHHQRRVVTQYPAQVVQLAPQIRARLCLGGIGPEEHREMTSGLRDVRVQDEVREHSQRAR